jgi:hypothetical protein
MTKNDEVLIKRWMNNKYPLKWTLDNIYYYHYGNLFGDHTPEYSRIIRSVVFLAEQIRKEL